MSSTNFVVQELETASLWCSSDARKLDGFPSLGGGPCEFSEDGQWLATAEQEHVVLVNMKTMKKTELNIPGVTFLHWSPCSTYLATHSNYKKEVNEKNLQVWNALTNTALLQLTRKSVQAEQWPLIQFVNGQAKCVAMGKDALTVYNLSEEKKPSIRIPLPGVAAVKLSPKGEQFASYVPSTKAQPANVSLYHELSTTVQPAARKSFFQCNDMKLMWNNSGTAVLALASIATDSTNQSYYGDSKLYYLPLNGNECSVPSPKEGPIHDVQWSPSGKFFFVIGGFVPCKATLYSSNGQEVQSITSGAYNTIRWAPGLSDTMFYLAGFGSLPGDIWFYQREGQNKANTKFKVVGHTRSPCVTCEWSPCGRFVLGAQTAPRLRVDNQFKTISLYGDIINKVPFEVLRNVTWQPHPPGTFPERPATPSRIKPNLSQPGVIASGGGYVPPHLRGKVKDDSAPKQNFSMDREQAGTEEAAPVSKSASKNAKRRAKKANEKGTEKVPPTASEQATQWRRTEPLQSDQDFQLQDFTKKIRNLKKKLEQIEEIKRKPPQELNESQLAKLHKQPEFQAQLVEVETKLRELQMASTNGGGQANLNGKAGDSNGQ